MQDATIPELELPEPDRRALPGAQLELVVGQVRFEEVEGLEASTVALAIGPVLGAGASGVQLPPVGAPTGEGATAVERSTGWQFFSADEAWTVTLLANQVSLATGRYTRWSDFSARFEILLRTIGDVLSPDLEQRVGLRYVDRLTRPRVETAHGWVGWISPWFLGPAGDRVIGPFVRSTQQHLDVALGAGRFALARHGAFPDPAEEGLVSYLLDFDVYREGLRAFDLAEILEEMGRFNRLHLQLFQSAVTPALLDELSREEGSR